MTVVVITVTRATAVIITLIAVVTEHFHGDLREACRRENEARRGRLAKVMPWPSQ